MYEIVGALLVRDVERRCESRSVVPARTFGSPDYLIRMA
jgi:hypothetical protein